MIRVGLLGLGAINTAFTKLVSSSEDICIIKGYDIDRAARLRYKQVVEGLGLKVRLVDAPDELWTDDEIDLVVEAASYEALSKFAKPIVSSGKRLVPLSVGGILLDEDLKRLYDNNKQMFLLVGGAIGTYELYRFLKTLTLKRVSLITEKPPKALGLERVYKEKTLLEDVPDVDALRMYPKNLNVVALLNLALDMRVYVTLRANPNLSHNVHTVEVVAEEARFSFRYENLPDKDNPRTSALTAYSLIYDLIRQGFEKS